MVIGAVSFNDGGENLLVFLGPIGGSKIQMRWKLDARAIREALKVFKTSYSSLSVESDSSVVKS